MNVTSAAGNIAVFPAGVGVGGVTPGSPLVCIRVSAEVGLQVCSWVVSRCEAAEDTLRKYRKRSIRGYNKRM